MELRKRGRLDIPEITIIEMWYAADTIPWNTLEHLEILLNTFRSV